MTAISPSDIQYYLSAPGASSGFSIGGTPENSLGGWISNSLLSGTPMDNLFTDITGAENAASQVDYQCLFILNNTATGNSMINTVAWLPTATDISGGATVAVALDSTGATIKNSTSQQALKITSPTSAPSGISTWVSNVASAPTSPSYTGGLQIGTLAPGYCIAIWVQRTAHNTLPVNADGFGMEIDFDTQG